MTIRNPFSIHWDWRYVKLPRKVEIKSRLVARLRGFVSFCVCFYTAYDIFAKQRYLTYDDPVGTFRVRLKDPTSLTFENFKEAPYCRKAGSACRWVDAVDATYGFQPDAIFITTKLQEKHQTKKCVRRIDGKCERWLWEDLKSTHAFVAHIEDFTLRVSASVEFPEHHLSHSVEPKELPLAQWLALAGTELDAQSDSPSTRVGFDSFRDEGMVLVVRMLYSNTASYTPLLEWVLAEWGGCDRPQIETVLNVRRVRGKEFKETQRLSEWSDGDTRTLWKRHGVFVQFEDEARVGRFSTSVLLLTVVKSFGLLWAGTFIVDQYLRLCHRKLYGLLVDRTVHDEHIKLSRDELALKLGEKYDQVGASPSEFVQGLFLEADRDGDNALSRPELKHLFEILGIRLTNEALDDIFENCDQDQNGNVDMAEFEAWLKDLIPTLQPPEPARLKQA